MRIQDKIRTKNIKTIFMTFQFSYVTSRKIYRIIIYIKVKYYLSNETHQKLIIYIKPTFCYS